MLIETKERCPVCSGWGYDREELNNFLKRTSHIKGDPSAIRSMYRCSYCNGTGVVIMRLLRHKKWKA